MTETSLKEITKSNGAFSYRLTTKEVTIEGTVFTVKAIPSLLATYIQGQATNDDGTMHRGVQMVEYLRFGLANVSGSTFRPMKRKVMGMSFDVCPDDILGQIPPNAQTILFSETLFITHLSEDERKKLDFTTPSDNTEGSPVTSPADAVAEIVQDARDVLETL